MHILRWGTNSVPSPIVSVGTYLPTVAASPVMAWGTSRMIASHAGPLARARRSVDSAEADIAAVAGGQMIDRAAALAYQNAVGGGLYVAKAYDQSGNGNHAAQTVTASMLQLYLDGVSDVSMMIGRRTVAPANTASHTAPRTLVLPALPTVDRNACTVFMVVRQASNYRKFPYFDFGNPSGNSDLASMEEVSYQASTKWDDAGTLRTSLATGSLAVQAVPSATPSVLCWRPGNPAGPVNRVNRDGVLSTSSNFTQPSSRLLTNPGQIGMVKSWTGPIVGEVLAYLVYPASLSDADIAAVRAALGTIYAAPAVAPTQSVFCLGDSITEGAECYGLQNLDMQIKRDFGPATLFRNFGQSGILVSALVAAVFVAGHAARWRVPGALNALHLMAGTNDITAGRTAAAIYADLQTLCANYRANVGTKIVMATLLPRNDGAWSPGFETVRLQLNTLIRAGLGADYDALADWAADATMGSTGAPNNPALFSTDKLHPVENGYTYLRPISTAALKSPAVGLV